MIHEMKICKFDQNLWVIIVIENDDKLISSRHIDIAK